MKWKNILVPHDFSACAARALHVAADLAKVHRATIAILHVSELPENLTEDAVVEPPGEHVALRIGDYAARGALQKLEAIAEPLRGEGIPILTRAVTGDVAENILVAAQD